MMNDNLDKKDNECGCQDCQCSSCVSSNKKAFILEIATFLTIVGIFLLDLILVIKKFSK